MIRNLCNYLNSLKKLHFNSIVIILCLLPFVFLFVIIFILILITTSHPGAVVSNAPPCAEIGKKILTEGGTVVDSAIATLLCEGIAVPSNCGVGGGFAAIIYIAGKFDTITAIPTAPAAVGEKSEELFEQLDTKQKDKEALYAGVPGELMGYWEMHKKYGVTPWRLLIEPSIKLCEEGIPVTQWYASILRHLASEIDSSETMQEVFPPISGLENVESDANIVLKFPKLAETLREIANKGVDEFYKGPLGKKFIEDVQKAGGLITEEDLRNYKVSWNPKPVTVRLGNKFKLYTTPLPTAGPLVAFILNVMKAYNYRTNEPLFWHKAIEAMKHSFGHRLHLGDYENDPEMRSAILRNLKTILSANYAQNIRDLIKDDRTFNDSNYYGAEQSYKFDKGSASVCISSPTGDAVVATSTLSRHFGSFFRSEKTGIIVNNQLRSFMSPGKPYSFPNRLFPGKRPLSSVSPTIILSQQSSRIHFLVSATGGPKITTLLVNCIIRHIWMKKSPYESVNGLHFHNQLFPDVVEYDYTIGSDLLEFLKKVGHKLVFQDVSFDDDPSLTCISHAKEKPNVAHNNRRDTSSAFLEPRDERNSFLIVAFLTLLFCGWSLLMYDILIAHTKKNERESPTAS